MSKPTGYIPQDLFFMTTTSELHNNANDNTISATYVSLQQLIDASNKKLNLWYYGSEKMK